MKKHLTTGDAKTVKSAVKSVFVHYILLLMCPKENKVQETRLSSLKSICLLRSRICGAENYYNSMYTNV